MVGTTRKLPNPSAPQPIPSELLCKSMYWINCNERDQGPALPTSGHDIPTDERGALVHSRAILKEPFQKGKLMPQITLSVTHMK